jgi:hypothetical protein
MRFWMNVLPSALELITFGQLYLEHVWVNKINYFQYLLDASQICCHNSVPLYAVRIVTIQKLRFEVVALQTESYLL